MTGSIISEKSIMMERAQNALSLHGTSIYRMAYSYLHHKEDAEDILQETLIKYMKSSPQFQGEDHEKAWLLTVAANLSKNKINHNKVRNHDELREELMSDDTQNLLYLWDAVKELPDIYREVIHLFYQEGYSTRDIAGILSISESAVRVRLNRGRKSLKEILKEEYDFEE